MRVRLFFKIFISFLFSVLLLGALLTLTSYTRVRERSGVPLRKIVAEALKLYGERIASASVKGDAKEELKDLEDRTSLKFSLVTPQKVITLHEELKTITPGLLESRPEPARGGKADGSEWPEVEEDQLNDLRASPPQARHVKFHVFNGNTYAVVFLPEDRKLIVEMPKRQVRRVRGVLTPTPFRLLIVGGTLFLTCFLLAQYLTRPLKVLSLKMRQFANGDLSARVGSNTPRHLGDELSSLGKDFDAMAQKIQDLVENQKQLLSDVSHELRSPLTRLNLARELAEAKGGDTSKFASEFKRIKLESDRLNDLIATLLKLSRMENLKEALSEEFKKVDLKRVVEEVVKDAQFEAVKENKRVELKTESEPLYVQGIQGLLSGSVENVVRNALYYTKEVVKIEIKREGQWAVVSVTDNGGGVKKEALEKIFLPFYRAEQARERERGGVGLGLSITQRSVEIHGGKVRAENYEEGLKVTITLPLKNN